METWQKNHIQKNIVELIQNTTCHQLLFARLTTKGLLSENEIDILKTIGKSEGDIAQCNKLYDIIVKKANAYVPFAKSLLEERQTGVLEVLLKGYEDEGVEIPVELQNYKEECVQQMKLTQSDKEDLNKASVEIFKNTIPEELSYYVARRVTPRNVISRDVFNHGGIDIFVLTGMERYHLASVVIGRTDTSRNQINQKKISVRFIILQMKSDFEDICRITKNPVHWLHCLSSDKEYLYWVKSRGSMESLQRFVITNTQIMYTEDEFVEMLEMNEPIDKLTTPVCISDTPGMGKSVLLGHIGRNLKRKFADRLVVFIVIGEFNANFKRQRKQLSANELLDIILSQVSLNELGRNAFINKIKSGKCRLELLVDGFDEVASEDQEQAAQNLKLLSNSFKNIRIWVTTRPHLLEKLENSLETLGYNIQPFDPKDQINFLVSYWSQNDTNMHFDKSRLIQFALNCLEILKSRLNDKESSIAGIPLQCMLIGEVYEKDAKNYSDLKNYLKQDHVPAEICVNSITDLYSLIIEKKILDDRCKYPDLSTAGQHAINKHVHLSLLLLFPDCADTLKKYLHSDMSDEEIIRIGLVESTGSGSEVIKFIHRTFAEYFVALFVFHRLKTEWNGELTIFLFEKFLRPSSAISKGYLGYGCEWPTCSFQNEVACLFLDSLMQDFDPDKPNLVSLINKSPTANKINQIYHALVYLDFANIFKFFDSLNLFDASAKYLYYEELVFISVRHSNIELFSIICDKFKRSQSVSVSSVRKEDISVLHEAVRRGNYGIVEYLLKTENFHELVKNSELNGLLHLCVTQTSRQDPDVIMDKIEIIKALVGVKKRLLEEPEKFGRTPILCMNIHKILIKELIHIGGNIEAVDENGDTLLHKTIQDSVDSQEYYEIMSLLPMQNLKNLVHMKDMYGKPALVKLVEKMAPNEKTLELFNKAEADFNFVNPDGHTVLATAIKFGNGVDIFRMLIKYGAEFNRELPQFIHSAAEGENLPVLKYLVTKIGTDINLKDSEGNTPLHTAAENWKLDAVKFLIDHDAKVNVRNNKGNTPLHTVMLSLYHYTYQHCSEMVNLLVENGSDLAALNDLGNTPVSCALEETTSGLGLRMLMYFETEGWLNTPEQVTYALGKAVTLTGKLDKNLWTQFVDKLVQRGGNLNYVDIYWNTLLHTAASWGSSYGVRYLISKGLNVNARNCDQQTPIYSAALFRLGLWPEGRLEAVKALTESGAEIKTLDKYNETPIHAAIKGQIDTEVLEYLLSTGQYTDVLTRDDVVYFSAEHSCFYVFAYVCEQYESGSGRKIMDIEGNDKYKSVLHAALRRRDWNTKAIVDFFGETVEYDQQRLSEDRFKDLIHCCVSDTENIDVPFVLQSLIDTVMFLVKWNGKLLSRKDDKGQLVIEVEGIHPVLREIIIELHANEQRM